MKKYKYAVVVGRFQPFHNHHKALVDRAFEWADEVYVVIGSSSSKRTEKNPFLVTERIRMIRDCYPGKRLFFVPAIDYPESDSVWADQVIHHIQSLSGDEFGSKGILVCNCKPGEDYVPRLLDFWVDRDVTYHNHDGDGTTIRRNYFNGRPIIGMVPEAIAQYLTRFESSKFFDDALDAYVGGGSDDAA